MEPRRRLGVQRFRTAWVETHATGTGKREKNGVMRNMHENLHKLHNNMHNMRSNMHVMHLNKTQAGDENQNASDCRCGVCVDSGPLAGTSLPLNLCTKVHNAGQSSSPGISRVNHEIHELHEKVWRGSSKQTVRGIFVPIRSFHFVGETGVPGGM